MDCGQYCGWLSVLLTVDCTVEYGMKFEVWTLLCFFKMFYGFCILLLMVDLTMVCHLHCERWANIWSMDCGLCCGVWTVLLRVD